MRHGDKINALGRKSAHRKATLSSMAVSLIKYKKISTTLAKAKELRKYIEPLLTKSKSDTTHARRTVFSYLQNKIAVAEVFRDIAPKIASRPGGYTRILKTGFRRGDGAETCFIELVDFNETYALKGAEAPKAKKTRRGAKKAGAESAKSEATTKKAPKSDADAAE